jgi:hypothetical protein
MRFSITTIWLNLKIHLLLAELIFAIGFYLGMIQHILSCDFWPGLETLPGLIVFVTLGILAGLNGPNAWQQTASIFRPVFPGPLAHPFVLARGILLLLSLIVFLIILSGVYFTHHFIQYVQSLPDHFLLDAPAWKIILFCLPALPAGLIGIVLGLIFDIAFVLTNHIASTDKAASDHANVHTTIRKLLVWIIISIAGGWSLGYAMIESFPEKRLKLILFPLTFCLLVLLFVLLDNHENIPKATTTFHTFQKLVPDIAAYPSELASLMVVTLGFFGIWEYFHWNYALTNWFVAAETFGSRTTLFILSILTFTAIAFGLVTGYRFFPKKLNRYLTTLDRQGISMAILGLSVIITTAVTCHTLKAELLQTIVPFCLIPLCLILLAASFGSALGMAIPGLAVGRANHIDLWQSTISRLSIGMIIAGISLLAWRHFNPGNLIAIATGAICALATGGIAIIYDNPDAARSERESRKGKIIHTSGIIFLYISLLIILLIVPSLKNKWLKSTYNHSVWLVESPAGVASCTSDSNSPLVWAGTTVIPERTQPADRQDTFDLIQQIVDARECSFYLPIRLLLVGLPKLEPNSKLFDNTRSIHEVDIDKSIRRMEYRIRNQSNNSWDYQTLPDLAFRRNHYNLILAYLPASWPRDTAWPSPDTLADMLLAQAVSPDVLCFIQPISNYVSLDAKTKRLISYLKQKTGHTFKVFTRSSKNGRDWHIIASNQSHLAD